MAVATLTHHRWKTHAVTTSDNATQTPDHFSMDTDDDSSFLQIPEQPVDDENNTPNSGDWFVYVFGGVRSVAVVVGTVVASFRAGAWHPPALSWCQPNTSLVWQTLTWAGGYGRCR